MKVPSALPTVIPQNHITWFKSNIGVYC